MSLVLDSSVTLACIYLGENTSAVQEVLDQIIQGGAWVPGLWRLEVANILEMGVHRGRHDAVFRDGTLADLALLPIHVDLETDQRAWEETARLAERHRLTLYDAAYLELALRRKVPLATLDQDLRSAAKKENSDCLPLSGRVPFGGPFLASVARSRAFAAAGSLETSEPVVDPGSRQLYATIDAMMKD